MYTQMQINFNINMVALIKNQPKLMNLKIIIKEFINHRKTIIIKRTIYKLKEYQNWLRWWLLLFMF
jgi:DNA gyrase subunit A